MVPLAVLLSPDNTHEYCPLAILLVHPDTVEFVLLAVLLVHHDITEAYPLATLVLEVLNVCKSTALPPLLLPHVAVLSAIASVNAPVPLGTMAISTLVAAFVADSDTTGTVALGADVFTASVKLVSHPPHVALSVLPEKERLVPSIISSTAPEPAVLRPSRRAVLILS